MNKISQKYDIFKLLFDLHARTKKLKTKKSKDTSALPFKKCVAPWVWWLVMHCFEVTQWLDLTLIIDEFSSLNAYKVN